MTVKIKMYDGVKYDMASKKVAEKVYEIQGYKIICGGAEAEEIESMTDGNSIDEYHEYLVLDLGNDETATFLNSHVDMFRF